MNSAEQEAATPRPGAEAHHGALKRSMKLLGILLITVSAITPASSVFIIAPGVIQEAGSGAFLSFVAAAIVGIFMAYVYAELSSAFPLTGGEYAIIGRVLGPFPGFVVLGLTLVTLVLIVAVIALGVGIYLGAVFPDLPTATTAAVTVIVSTLVAILNIRTNAVVTGIFLCIEILALLVLSVLGFTHMSRPLTDLMFHPVVLDSSGALAAAPVAAIGLATSVAIFAYNGYGQAVYFGEETHDAPRHIARAILWALAITVFAELVPVTAILLGAPDLKALLGSQNMLGDFITARGGATLNTVISLTIALAIFNAVIAILLQVSRLLFSTARDQAWTPALNRVLASTHSRFHSPWAATVVCGVLGAAACYVNENLLFVITGTSLVVIYAALCVAAIAGRRTGSTAHGVYRMPLFPLAPIAAALALVYVTYANWEDPVIGRPSLYTTVGIIVISAIYYAAILRRRGNWELRGPAS
jgi:amino acid transporter